MQDLAKGLVGVLRRCEALPFARCRIRTGEIVRVPREATESERETLRQRLEETMKAITEDW